MQQITRNYGPAFYQGSSQAMQCIKQSPCCKEENKIERFLSFQAGSDFRPLIERITFEAWKIDKRTL